MNKEGRGRRVEEEGYQDQRDAIERAPREPQVQILLPLLGGT